MRFIVISFFLIFYLNTVLTAQIKPVQLTCEYLENPSVVDEMQPRLSWVNISETSERGQNQTAWQIRVASSKQLLEKPDLWDSKKVDGNQSTRIKYEGVPLKSRQDCWWQVRVWDTNGEVSGWSEPAFWHMGLLDESDWQATWIGAPWQGEETLPKPSDRSVHIPEHLPPPAPMLRKDFTVKKEVAKAVAYVTGLGYFELYLNGEKVGDDVLVPNQTNYSKRPDLPQKFIPVEDDFREYKVMYLAYDVKDMLKQGENAIGSILGNGFYNPASAWTEGYGSPLIPMVRKM
jgi:alpha-L-rhamnosidase